ncbi:MAG: MGMT family protein [Parcubacteria group bacterium]|nr:MGMT family protein [Parcubacteria group bacterium]
MKNGGATFAEKVLKVVRRIPCGEVLTYKEVARRAGAARAYRAAGNVLAQNRNSAIPCHRVIRSDGATGGYNRGAAKKRRLLEAEGAVTPLAYP